MQHEGKGRYLAGFNARTCVRHYDFYKNEPLCSPGGV